MGLIRGSLHIFTYGAVSPKSKKQRMASMQLAAMQGKSQAEIKAAGGRNFDIVNEANLRAKQQRELRMAAQRADPQRLRQETEVRQPTPQSDAISELERLAALHQSGALDDDEFRAAKEHVIGTLAQKPADELLHDHRAPGGAGSHSLVSLSAGIVLVGGSADPMQAD